MMLDLKQVDSFIGNKEYMSVIDDTVNSLKQDPMIQFVPNISLAWNYGEETKNNLQRLYGIIIPYMEKQIYNCPIQVVDVKFLRHLKSESEHREGAFVWHTDNHPAEILNIIIYLSDVGKDCGGMQYASYDGKIMKQEYREPTGGIVLDGHIRSLRNDSKFKTHNMLGNKGALFIFDNCITHRASTPTLKDRDALLLQVTSDF